MGSSQGARIGIATLVVAFYIAFGYLLRLDANTYLLVGVPLLLVFQRFIARRPLTELWLKRYAGNFITGKGLLLAIPFLVYPLWRLVADWNHASWPIRIWEIAAVAGTIPLGATLARATLGTWWALLGCLLTAGVLSGGLMVAGAIMRHHGFHPPRDAWRVGAGSFLLYLPVCFVIEEVFFRGGIDSYVQREGDREGWLTAVYVSCLWGWWHFPTVPCDSLVVFIVFAFTLPMTMSVPGISFSLFGGRADRFSSRPRCTRSLTRFGMR